MKEVKRLTRHDEWVMPHVYPHIKTRMEISDGEYFVLLSTHVELDKEPNLLQWCTYRASAPIDKENAATMIGACVKEFIDICEVTKKEAVKPPEESLKNPMHDYRILVD